MESLIAAGVVALGFFGEASFGFGGGLIVIPFLSLLLGIKTAVTLALVFQLLMGLLLIAVYKDIYWKNASLVLTSLIIGSLAGTYFLASVDENVLRIILAVGIFAFLLRMYVFKNPSVPFLRKGTWASATTAVAGWIQGVIGTGGPVMAIYLSALELTKEQVRATLVFYLFITSVVRFPASYASGLFTNEIISLALFVLPFFIAAIVLGNFVHKKIPEAYYRFFISLILLVSGVALIVKVVA